MKRLSAVLMLGIGSGCLQLTGVSDFKVEESCTITPGSSCRVAPNCGCPATETCQLKDANGSGACEAAGGTGRGGSCASNGECARGLGCIGGECSTYCRNDTDCPEKQCEPLSFGMTPVNGVGVCNAPCDPGAVVCADGRACKFLRTERTTCVAAGSVANGGACTNDGQCVAGSVCVGGASGNVCASMCRAGEDCPAGPCQPVELRYQGIQFGVCPPG